jgi:acyl carrier protein
MSGASVIEQTAGTIRHMLVNDLYIELEPEKIGLDDGLQSVIGVDSIGFSELRILLERKFDVQISDADYTPDNFSSVRRVVSLLARLKSW